MFSVSGWYCPVLVSGRHLHRQHSDGIKEGRIQIQIRASSGENSSGYVCLSYTFLTEASLIPAIPLHHS